MIPTPAKIFYDLLFQLASSAMCVWVFFSLCLYFIKTIRVNVFFLRVYFMINVHVRVIA